MISIDTMFESTQMLWFYCTRPLGYNMFIMDNINDNKLIQMKRCIDTNDKINAIKLYRQLDRDIDALRDMYCYNVLPYKSSFRQIAKDMYIFLKDSWLLYNDDFEYVGKVLKFISTSDYYIIREYFIRRSYSMFYMDKLPLDPDSFYCRYVPLEAFLDYAIKLLNMYMGSD